MWYCIWQLFTKEVHLKIFLIDHLEGCTPLEPCASCRTALAIRKLLGDEKFFEIANIISNEITGLGTGQSASLDTSVEKLPFSVRVACCLKNGNISTIGDLLAVKEDAMLRIPNFGPVCLKEVKGILARYGHRLNSI